MSFRTTAPYRVFGSVLQVASFCSPVCSSVLQLLFRSSVLQPFLRGSCVAALVLLLSVSRCELLASGRAGSRDDPAMYLALWQLAFDRIKGEGCMGDGREKERGHDRF